jgi:hypothetical protein
MRQSGAIIKGDWRSASNPYMVVREMDVKFVICLGLLGMELCPAHRKYPHLDREPIPPAHQVRDRVVAATSTTQPSPFDRVPITFVGDGDRPPVQCTSPTEYWLTAIQTDREF